MNCVICDKTRGEWPFSMCGPCSRLGQWTLAVERHSGWCPATAAGGQTEWYTPVEALEAIASSPLPLLGRYQIRYAGYTAVWEGSVEEAQADLADIISGLEEW